jgi:hypothetical protein
MQIVSEPSSATQKGRHEPQYRLRLMFQSRASRSQLPKRFLPTASGTQAMESLSVAIFSRRSSMRTYQASTAR